MSKLSVGIVGLPNVGKSTLFNALLKQQQALAANYPFATVEPNVGVVPVPDERLEKLAEVVGTERIVPAVVEFLDIAGLVAGAHKGEGLGNKFLAHIREVDLICQVVRGFEEADVVETGSGDMVDDYITIETELQLADLATLSKQQEPKGAVSREEKERWSVVVRLREALEKGVSAREVEMNKEEMVIARELFLLTAKKKIVVLNVGEKRLGEADDLKRKLVEEMAKKKVKVTEEDILVISAKVETELGDFNEEERKAYLNELGVSEGGLEKLVAKSYERLGLLSFLTAGVKEVRAWTVRRGARAPEAAGVIHSDFEKKFIKAKVCGFEDFMELKGWKGVAEAGKLRLEGKEYEMREGDVVEFMIGN